MKTQFQAPEGRSGVRWWLARLALAGGALFLLAGTITWVAGRAARSQLVQQYSPPGQLVDVGGYKMHLNCMGEGEPTVILEAGLRDFSVHWALAQAEVARFTKVCSYDRAGIGWSEPSPFARTSYSMVGELHTLLTKAQVEKPYLLVGHSFGGMNMRLYATHYPEEIVGLVLVDAMHEEQGTRLPAYGEANKKVDRQFRLLALLREAGIIALVPDKVPGRDLPDEASAQYAAILATTRYFENARAESQALSQSFAEVRATSDVGLGDIPLIVLSRSYGERLPGLSPIRNQQNEVQWQLMQAELVGLSASGEQIMAEQSGHNIPLQQPELVVEAIRRLVLSPATHASGSTDHGGAATPAKASSSPPTAMPTPEPAPTASPAPTGVASLAEVAFTLRTAFTAGRMLYIGVGGATEGLESPELVVAPGTVVSVLLVNDDDISHDIFFPDFSVQSEAVGRKGQTTEVTFTIPVDTPPGAYVYYCTKPGHRQAGQEGWLMVEPDA